MSSLPELCSRPSIPSTRGSIHFANLHHSTLVAFISSRLNSSLTLICVLHLLNLLLTECLSSLLNHYITRQRGPSLQTFFCHTADSISRQQYFDSSPRTGNRKKKKKSKTQHQCIPIRVRYCRSKASGKNERAKKQKHTTAGIRWWCHMHR